MQKGNSNQSVLAWNSVWISVICVCFGWPDMSNNQFYKTILQDCPWKINVVFYFLQVLTLASNERVPLTPSMRLLFEIGHLKTATPATVSRAGILFLNYADVGWNPWVPFSVCLLVPCDQVDFDTAVGCLYDVWLHCYWNVLLVLLQKFLKLSLIANLLMNFVFS